MREEEEIRGGKRRRIRVSPSPPPPPRGAWMGRWRPPSAALLGGPERRGRSGRAGLLSGAAVVAKRLPLPPHVAVAVSAHRAPRAALQCTGAKSQQRWGAVRQPSFNQ